MGTYKEETLRAKAVKAGIIDQRPLLPKSKKERPFVVEYRRNIAANGKITDAWGPWKTWRKYATRDGATMSIAKQAKGWMAGRYEFRHKEEK